MAHPLRNSSWASWVADAALLLALLTAPLSVGGVYLWSQMAVLAWVIIGLLASMWHHHQRQRRVPLPVVMAAPALLSLAVLLQLLPLPARLIAGLSPRADATFATTLGALGRYRFHALSLDPASTWGQLGVLSLACLLLLLAYHRRCRPGGGRRVVGMVALSGLAVLVVSLVQTLANLRKVYGVFGYAEDRLLHTPFINPNHAAAFLGMSACAALGLALRHRDRVRAVMWGAASVGLAAGTLLTLSRGGMLALLGAALLLGWLLLRREQASVGLNSVVTLGLVAVLALASYLGLEAIEAELATLGADSLAQSKATIWFDALRMAWSFFAVGVGRGAFAFGFTQFDVDAATRRPIFAESWPIQVAADFGIPVAVLLLSLCLAALVRSLTQVRKTHQIAALTGLFFLGVQNLADFSVEMLGVAAPALALLACLSARPRGTRDPARLRSLPQLRPWQGALGVVLLAVLIVATSLHARQRDSERVLTKLATQKNSARRGQIAAHALIEHPADYRFAYSIAQAALTKKTADPDQALRWINRSLFLNPANSTAYRLAAQLLWRRGARGQALENWRRSARLRPAGAGEVIGDLLSTPLPAQELLDGVPPDQRLRLCATARTRRGNEASRACIDRLLARDPGSIPTLRTAAQWALSERDLPRAQSLVDRLLSAERGDAQAHVLAGKIALARGQEQQAVQLWTKASREVGDPWPLYRELHLHALSRKNYVLARQHLQSMRRSSLHDVNRSAMESLFEARLYLRQEQLSRALRAIELTLVLRPAWPSAMITQVQCLEALQRYPQALRVLDRLKAGGHARSWVESSAQRIKNKQKQKKLQARRQALENGDPLPD